MKVKISGRLPAGAPVFILAFLTGMLTITFLSCGGRNSSETAGTKSPAAADEPVQDNSPPRSLYLQLVDGLHVTGSPIPVDPADYRLKVTGAVEKPLSLTFDEIKQMPSVTDRLVLTCPGFFTDEGEWTGVPLKAVLEMAGVKEKEAQVVFIALDESYRTSLPLETVLGDGFILAYQFNGKEFPEIHGFPLRLTAKDMDGANWVKWLGEIRVEKLK
ncbi:MAG: hypothetical protein E4H36_07725 [Spirochaetales bacterium]|nr:MAG: hypothetical protein E4H36_07725 [Spirochaetales bacterium]